MVTRRREAEKLTFIVRFVQMDMDALRAGDWLNLREDLARYLSLDRDVCIQNKDDPRWDTTPPDVITAIQKEARKLFDTSVDSQMAAHEAYREWRERHPEKPDTITMLLSPGLQGVFTLEYCMMTETAPGGAVRAIGQVYGDPRSALLYAVFQDLQHTPMDMLRCCPECQTLFVRVRKQVYCSRACLNRSGIRRWRETPAGKQYEETRARTRYEQKVKDKTSPSTQVKRHRKGAASAQTPRE